MEESIHYQCQIVHSLEVDREFTGFNRAVHMRQIILRVLICLLLICISRIYTSGWMLFFYAAFFIAIDIWNTVSLRKGSRYYKQIQVMNHGKPYEHTIFFADGEIHTVESSSGNVQRFSYDHLHSVHETKNLLILVFDGGICLLVDKNTLTGGSKEEFIAFLKGCCPNFKGKASKCTFRRIITAVYAVVLVVVLFIGLFRIPQMIDLTDRLIGRIPYTATCDEIVQELEDLGITGFDRRLIYDCESYYSEYSATINNREYKIPDLLEAVGSGYYHEDSTVWHHSDSGVFYYGMDYQFVSKPYTYLLKGIATLDQELDFQSIQEVRGERFITISFSWKGQRHILTAPNLYGVFSTDVLIQLNAIIKEQGMEKQVYYAVDNENGMLFFYRDAQWAKDFQHKTGMMLY